MRWRSMGSLRPQRTLNPESDGPGRSRGFVRVGPSDQHHEGGYRSRAFATSRAIFGFTWTGVAKRGRRTKTGAGLAERDEQDLNAYSPRESRHAGQTCSNTSSKPNVGDTCDFYISRQRLGSHAGQTWKAVGAVPTLLLSPKRSRFTSAWMMDAALRDVRRGSPPLHRSRRRRSGRVMDTPRSA